MERGPELVPLVVGAWLVLAAVGGWLFGADREAALKRRWYPPAAVGAGVLFVLVALALGVPAPGLVVLVPAAALVTAVNLWQTGFCPACGAGLSRFTHDLVPTRYCPRCGAALDGEPEELLSPERAAAVRARVAAEAATKSATPGADSPPGRA
jgi:hypothetical protein